MMLRKIRSRDGRLARVLVLLAIASVAALPAAAAVFTVTLTNGTTLDTRYRPTLAADESKIQLITEHGNWITLPRSLVASIESDFEARGFGTVLDTDTIVIGYSINDLPVPEAGQTSGAEQLYNLLRGPESPPPFSVQQFAEPNSGGRPTGGIPVGFTNSTTPPLGGGLVGEPPVVGENQ